MFSLSLIELNTQSVVKRSFVMPSESTGFKTEEYPAVSMGTLELVDRRADGIVAP